MAELGPMRVIGAVMMAAGVLYLVAVFAYPPYAEPVALEPRLRQIAGSRLWLGPHVWVFAVGLAVAAGLFIVQRDLAGRALLLARAAGVIALVAVVLWAVIVGLNAIALKPAADAWAAGADAGADAGAAELLVGAQARWRTIMAVYSVSSLLFWGVAFILVGGGLLVGGGPTWLGWVAVGQGTAAALVALGQFAPWGTDWVLIPLFAISGLLVLAWQIGLGSLLLRGAAIGG